MNLPKQIYYGLPRGVEKIAALIVLVINVVAPGIGTIISAFLGSETNNDTIFVGIGQLITSPLLGLGFFWAIAWSIRLYKTAGDQGDGEAGSLLSRDTESSTEAATPAPAQV